MSVTLDPGDYWLMVWLTDCLLFWLIGGWIDWLIDWWMHWWIQWLLDWLIGGWIDYDWLNYVKFLGAKEGKLEELQKTEKWRSWKKNDLCTMHRQRISGNNGGRKNSFHGAIFIMNVKNLKSPRCRRNKINRRDISWVCAASGFPLSQTFTFSQSMPILHTYKL